MVQQKTSVNELTSQLESEKNKFEKSKQEEKKEVLGEKGRRFAVEL